MDNSEHKMDIIKKALESLDRVAILLPHTLEEALEYQEITLKELCYVMDERAKLDDTEPKGCEVEYILSRIEAWLLMHLRDIRRFKEKFETEQQESTTQEHSND